MAVGRLIERAVAIAALVSLVAVTSFGCGRSTECGMPDKVDLPVLGPALEKAMASQPAWRNVNRVELAARLGWGQVSGGSAVARRIALTFDAGADAGGTPAVLDTLKAAGAHCTFFLTGQFAESNPDLVQRMVREGHEVGNHSYSHPRFTSLSPEEVARQLSGTEDAVRSLTGSSTKPYFRFPYGAGSADLVKQVNAQGYLCVLWTFDTLDSLGATADVIRQRVNKYARPGAIALMHCGSVEEAKALPGVMRDLDVEGYGIVTLTEVLDPSPDR